MLSMYSVSEKFSILTKMQLGVLRDMEIIVIVMVVRSTRTLGCKHLYKLTILHRFVKVEDVG